VAVDARAACTNSVVRFSISYGTRHFGNIDVELFDCDKPITVTNFLYYVQSGLFDRTILHRCPPEIPVVQGGQYFVDNPYIPSPLTNLTTITELPAITNEYFVNRIIPNDFGTIAMALSSEGGVVDTESATTSWFFNTADNETVLDTNYCVFGKIKSGSKYLQFFNTLSENDGLINMFGLDYLFSDCDLVNIDGDPNNGLDSLPVAYFFFDCPLLSDLFTVQISMVSGRDVVAPKISIITPKPGLSISNQSVTISGTVTDTGGVEQMRLYLNLDDPVEVPFNTNGNTWSVTFTNFPAGDNVFLVEATDRAGNRSTKTSGFFRSVALPLTLFLDGGTGKGTTAGPTNSQLLEVGRTYFLTAKPDARNLFAGWRKNGNLIALNTKYGFLMESNLALTAVFNTNLFPYIKGTYNGLFYNPERVEEISSGFLTLTLGDLGSYTAKMLLNGKSYSLRGAFDSGNGEENNFFSRAGSNELWVIRMNADLVGGTDKITGSFSNYFTWSLPTGTNITYTTNGTEITTNFTTVFTSYTNAWFALLDADRSVFSTANPAPLSGKFTLVLPPDTNAPAGPGGEGYGTVSISSKGALTFSGALADGVKVAQKVPVSKDGQWPLYLSPYKGRGMVLSEVAFDTNQVATDLSGLFNWFKQSDPKSKFYKDGITNEATLAGSRYVVPVGTNALLNTSNAVVSFTGGGLAADFANTVTITPPGKVSNNPTNVNKLTMSISKSSGLFSGSVTPPGATKALAYNGVVLQKTTNGAGFFLGTNATSGRVSIAP